MSVKMTGRELKNFWNDQAYWGELWTEGEFFTVNGVEKDEGFDPQLLKDDDQVILSGGEMCSDDAKDLPSTETFFERWRKAQSTKTIVVSDVPMERVDEVIAALRAMGLKAS